MEVNPELGQEVVAVKRFKFTQVVPHRLLVVHYDPKLPLTTQTTHGAELVLAYNGEPLVTHPVGPGVLVLSYNGVELAFAQSPLPDDGGRLTSTVFQKKIDCIWWETQSRVDLIFMNAVSNSAEPSVEICAISASNSALKGPATMQVSCSEASAAGTGAAIDSNSSAAAEPGPPARFTE